MIPIRQHGREEFDSTRTSQRFRTCAGPIFYPAARKMQKNSEISMPLYTGINFAKLAP